jgi:anaerobic magnesium-protoporphyrin IX monomethyl ester cyclase
VRRVLLVYPGYVVREQPLNVLYISAAVKAAGHASRLFEITRFRRRPLWGDPYRVMRQAFERELAIFEPDVVGFSVMSVNSRIALLLAESVKRLRPEALVLFGGIHPTVAPEETIGEKNVDLLCIGEGEESVTELLSALDGGREVSGLPGLWVKTGGLVFRNPIRPLIQDLDSLPFPDRDALPPELLRAELYGINLISSRGCPFPCTYCQNKFLMDLYRGRGQFVRYRSLENVFAEIDEVIRRYRPSRLSFSDESFTLNAARLEEFCREYPRRFNLPFLCQTRPDLLDETTTRRLRDAGCDFINMAIEAGNPRIRNEVLQRNISDPTIAEAFSLARRFGIRTGSFNMIGLPGETRSTIWDTINLNRALQPDRIMCTIYMPFRGTALGEKCLDGGWLEHPIDDSEVYYTYVAIRHPSLSSRTLFGYQGFFDYYVRLSTKLHWLIHLLRHFYQLLPVTTHRLPPPVRLLREAVINLVYWMKRFLPSRGFFMRTR